MINRSPRHVNEIIFLNSITLSHPIAFFSLTFGIINFYWTGHTDKIITDVLNCTVVTIKTLVDIDYKKLTLTVIKRNRKINFTETVYDK